MKYNYKDKVNILVKGKIVETFVNKKTTPCCDTRMKNYVVTTKGYEVGTFTLMRM